MKIWSGISVMCGVILIVGAIIIAEGRGENFFGQIRKVMVSEYTYHEEDISSSGIEKITVRAKNNRIEIRRVESAEQIKWMSNGPKDGDAQNYSVNNQDGNLIIEERGSRAHWFNFDFGWMFGDEYLIVEIPAGVVLDYDLEISNGKITIDKVNANELIAQTSNGAIEFVDVDADKINFRASNGVVFGNVVGERGDYGIKLGTSNGVVKVDGTGYGNHFDEMGGARIIDIKTNNGAIDLSFGRM